MLDESKLHKLKIVSNVVAVLSIVVFVVLIGYSINELNAINADIQTAQSRREELAADNERLEQELKNKQEAISELGKRYALLGDALEQLNQTNPALAETITEEAARSGLRSREELKPLVYLHIANESQRPRAQELANALQTQGYVVPSIENVGRKPGAKAPRQTELRVFARHVAEDVKGILRVLERQGFTVGLVTSGLVARPRQYEIWFGSDDARGKPGVTIPP